MAFHSSMMRWLLLCMASSNLMRILRYFLLQALLAAAVCRGPARIPPRPLDGRLLCCIGGGFWQGRIVRSWLGGRGRLGRHGGGKGD